MLISSTKPIIALFMKSIQYNAFLAITGAMRGTSTETLYQKKGLESLKLRLWFRKLCQFSRKTFQKFPYKCNYIYNYIYYYDILYIMIYYYNYYIYIIIYNYIYIYMLYIYICYIYIRGVATAGIYMRGVATAGTGGKQNRSNSFSFKH